MAANKLQFEKYLKAPPLPKYLLYQPAKARPSPPIEHEIPTIRFTAFALSKAGEISFMHVSWEGEKTTLEISSTT